MSDVPNNPPPGGTTPGGGPPGQPQGGPPPGQPAGGPPPGQPAGGPPPGQPAGGPPPGQPAGGPPPAAPPPPAAGPPPAAPQAPQAMSGIGQPADLVTRFLAKLIDWVLLVIVYFVVFVPIVFISILSTSVGSFGGFGFGGFSGMGFLVSLIGALIWIGYFAYLEANRGQTLGKMLMKIQVRGPDGQNPTMEHAFKRNAWMLLSIIPIIGGLAQFVVAIIIAVTINSNVPSRKGWHDEFAGGTSVIKIG